MSPSLLHEQHFWQQGYTAVAGLDEAGRGCWAGPVVAAAVVLVPEVDPTALHGLTDSKQLTAAQRATWYARLTGATPMPALAYGYGVGIVPAAVIDTYGILPATRLAMQLALLHLPCRVDALLLDALPLPDLRLPQLALIRGDRRAYAIAAASVLAKVTRDRLAVAAAQCFPGYGFAQHKGYGTALHRAALAQLGVCAWHRRSFAPIAAWG